MPNRSGRLCPALALAAAALALVAAPAAARQAQAAPGSAVSPLEPVYACARESDPQRRLACYDAAVATLQGREARAEIVTLDQERVNAVRREAFGFRLPSLPRLPRFGAAPAAAGAATAAGAAAATTGAAGTAPAGAIVEEEVERQTFTIVRVGQSGGRQTVETDTGQVWMITDPGGLQSARRAPFEVEIRAASLGSYLMQVQGSNRGYRVRRVQ